MFHTGRINIGNVQFSSVTQSCLTLCNPKNCSTPGFLSLTNSWSLLKLMSIESVMPSNSPSVVPFSSRSHSFPASGSFLMSRLFASGGLSIGASAFSPYLFRLQIFLSAILIPACALSSLAFCLMYSAYKLNQQGDNIQP